MRIFAIDPGPEHSGWVAYDSDEQRVYGAGVDDNKDLIGRLSSSLPHVLVYEKIASQGAAVGQEVFDTCFWTGAFAEAFAPGCDPRGSARVVGIKRHQVKAILCGTQAAKDANIRRVLLDMFGGDAAGRKGGALEQVKSHAWSALAVAVTYQKLMDYKATKESHDRQD